MNIYHLKLLKPFNLYNYNRSVRTSKRRVSKDSMEVLTFKTASFSILDSEEIRASPVEPVNRQSVQNQVTRRMSDTAKLSLVAGSWLFHDDDDDDANLWQLGPFAKEVVFQDLSQKSR